MFLEGPWASVKGKLPPNQVFSITRWKHASFRIENASWHIHTYFFIIFPTEAGAVAAVLPWSEEVGYFSWGNQVQEVRPDRDLVTKCIEDCKLLQRTSVVLGLLEDHKHIASSLHIEEAQQGKQSSKSSCCPE